MNPKYRPVLTSQQITHILTLCKSDMSEESISVISTLSVFEHKIRNVSVTPAYVEKPKVTLSESLGFPSNPTESLSIRQTQDSKSARESRKEALYKVWKENPDMRASFHVTDLLLVKEYRYENNLMETQEELEYEQGLFNMQSLVTKL